MFTLVTGTWSPHYKVVNVDIENSVNLIASEWGTACYHGNYNPNAAFDLEVQWLVATGCVLGVLVSYQTLNHLF